ncbi:MAG: DUF736 family protein [Alphaproteobacteria bacterium]|nr:DUF736 family protein [Alphaproteobacteria bacterium]
MLDREPAGGRGVQLGAQIGALEARSGPGALAGRVQEGRALAPGGSLWTTEFGADWKWTGRENREYLSVKLEHPSFTAPIFASMVEAGQGSSLIWARSRTAE